MKVTCQVCNKEYSPNGIHTHMMRAHGSPETKAIWSKAGNNGKYHTEEFKQRSKASREAYRLRKFGKLKQFEVSCHKCSKLFFVEEYEKKFPLKERYFCTLSCANSKTMTLESRLKISKTLSKKPKSPTNPRLYLLTCLRCGNTFEHIRTKKFCSVECKKEPLDIFESKRNYRIAASFKFSLNDFPNEFDFSLIEKYGWYLPKNRGDNLNGVSRDHKYSITDGYNNKVDPKILAHPANCQLLPHNKNVSKGTKSSITLEELLNLIEIWDKKYP